MRRPKKTVTINLADYLSAGTYNVKVKSKGTDIRDSAESNSVSCVVAAAGYNVSVYNDFHGACDIYDGQDSTGTYLGSVAKMETKIFTITSGYIYTTNSSMNFYVQSTGASGNPLQITSDISVELYPGKNYD